MGEKKTIRNLAKRLSKMEKRLAPPREAAKKKAELQAKAILKYFGRRKKVLVPDTSKEELNRETKSESAVIPIADVANGAGKNEEPQMKKKKNDNATEFDFS